MLTSTIFSRDDQLAVNKSLNRQLYSLFLNHKSYSVQILTTIVGVVQQNIQNYKKYHEDRQRIHAK